MLPNFLHIGAAKCKSSWLYKVCLEHPEIYVPGNHYDNVNFFVNTYHRGLEWYQNTYFPDVGEERAVGEFSNSYCCYEPALARIAKHMPDIKMTMTIMNPVHRIFYSWAHFFLKKKCRMDLFGQSTGVSRMEIQDLLERCGLDPQASLNLSLKKLVHHHGHSWFRQYGEPGMYAFNIKRIHRYFKPEQLNVMFYEDILADQDTFLASFYRFLGVDEDASIRLAPESVNPDPPIEDQWFPLELRAELTELFRDDIEELQVMCNRDLSHWLNTEDDLQDYCKHPR